MSAVRTVIATFDDEPPVGGQGVYVQGLRAALVRRGVAVRTVSGRGDHAVATPRVTGRAPLDLGIELTRHPSALLVPAVDVVHAQGGPGGVLLLRRLPVPVVYTAHHTYRQAYGLGAPRRALSLAERRAYGLAAAVLAVSESTAAAVRRLGVPGRRVEVVPPGVEVPDAVTAGGRDAEVLFVGRLEPEKGPLDAVAVMAALARDRPGTRGTVIGGGRLEARVREAAGRAVPGAVSVLGRVDADTLRSHYARAAVVVVPSRYEGLGLVALEAMAAGAAVVAYDVTGLRDAVAGAGVLVAPGDVGAMAMACRALLDDVPRRIDLAERARAGVVARHSWDAVAARVEEVYRAVAGS